MELKQTEVEKKPVMTYDEASMEQSKSFLTALQELKNLGPQLYSAAEHYEKSYHHHHIEQKDKVLHNLKDYAVQALVNTVDHLGTVAYNFNNLIEQNTMVISSMDPKIASLNQQVVTCQTYADKEGLRQQQMKANIPRHHKHYTLPSSVNKKVHFSPLASKGPGERSQTKTRLYCPDTPAANTLSWHLASETKSSLKRSQLRSLSAGSSNASNATVSSLDTETRSSRTKSNVANSPSAIVQTLGIKPQVVPESSRPTTPVRSFDSPSRKAIIRAPMHSKNLLFACLTKQKKQKPKTTLVL